MYENSHIFVVFPHTDFNKTKVLELLTSVFILTNLLLVLEGFPLTYFKQGTYKYVWKDSPN